MASKLYNPKTDVLEIDDEVLVGYEFLGDTASATFALYSNGKKVSTETKHYKQV